jgi:hypothetical protein
MAVGDLTYLAPEPQQEQHSVKAGIRARVTTTQ